MTDDGLGEPISYSWSLPSYCHECGKPYPWTERRQQALAEMLDELEELSPDEREKLKKSIHDIIALTPNSETAVLRFKKAASKVGKTGAKMLPRLLEQVAVEGVKKLLGL